MHGSDYPNCAGMGYDNVLVFTYFFEGIRLNRLTAQLCNRTEYIIKALTKLN